MSEQGRKYDGGKLRYDLVPTLALEEVVKVITKGAEKYDDDNWKNVPEGRRRYYAASMRHTQEWKKGNPSISVLEPKNTKESWQDELEKFINNSVNGATLTLNLGTLTDDEFELLQQMLQDVSDKFVPLVCNKNSLTVQNNAVLAQAFYK